MKITTTESTLRTDILTDEQIEEQKKIKFIAGTQFKTIVDTATRFDKTTTPGPAKNIIEVMELIKTAIEDRDRRQHKTADARVVVSYEDPDTDALLETITLSLIRREPGTYSQGRPMEGKVKQLRPILRELQSDSENPGYQRAIMGYFYDNVLQLTCWARTNKTANERAIWLETLMEDYMWWFVYSGTNRILYQGRASEKTVKIQNNKIYGRPINYFVRTEQLRTVSQKELEEIVVYLSSTSS